MKGFLFLCLVALLGKSMAEYDGYLGITAGPMKDQTQLEVVHALKDEDTRTKKVYSITIMHFVYIIIFFSMKNDFFKGIYNAKRVILALTYNQIA